MIGTLLTLGIWKWLLSSFCLHDAVARTKKVSDGERSKRPSFVCDTEWHFSVEV